MIRLFLIGVALGLLLAGCCSTPRECGLATDTVLTVERCAHRALAFDAADAACSDAAMHVPRIFELAEAYASGAAVDPGAEEWLYDRTVAYRDVSGEMRTRTPPVGEIFAFRCVLPIPTK